MTRRCPLRGGLVPKPPAHSGDSTRRNRAGLGHIPTESAPVHHRVAACVRVSAAGSAVLDMTAPRDTEKSAQTGVLRYGPRCLRALTGANTLITTGTVSSISLLSACRVLWLSG